MNESKIIDIHSRGEYPSCALSNFANYEFSVDGVPCGSMEGFLQSLKFKSAFKQRKICLLYGSQAKNSTKHSLAQLRWRLTKTLYWQGIPISRTSRQYSELLDRAYNELSKNEVFMKALSATEGSTLVHSIGKTDPRKTVLTEDELVSRLMKIRK